MNNHLVAALAALAALCSPARSQESVAAPSPAAEPLAVLVGQWRGTGSYSPEPDQPARPWTATSVGRWILGGHFVQEDVEIDLGGPDLLQTRTLFGWDAARSRFVALSLDNLGRSDLVELSWAGEALLVALATEVVDGQPLVLRSAWEFGDDGYTHRVDRARARGGWHRMIEGSFERVEQLPERSTPSAFGAEAIGAEMASLAPLIGAYTFEGERIDADDRSEGQLRGEETVRAMYGGQLLAAEVRVAMPDGERSEGARYFAWDPIDRVFDVYSIDDSGHVGVGHLRWEGDDGLFGVRLDAASGVPGLVTTLVELDGRGLRRVVARRILASREAAGRIELRYRRKEGGK